MEEEEEENANTAIIALPQTHTHSKITYNESLSYPEVHMDFVIHFRDVSHY